MVNGGSKIGQNIKTLVTGFCQCCVKSKALFNICGLIIVESCPLVAV